MTRQEVFDYCHKQYKTGPDYPWKNNNAVLRHSDNNKWYGLVMTVNAKKMGVLCEDEIDILNVKCDPILIGSPRMQAGFFPAYHMNKDKWISIWLEKSGNDEIVKNLIDWSFQATAAKKKKNSKGI